MKSIRVSLVVYLLLLLGAAWGAASWLVYCSAAESLRAKQAANQELNRTLYREREREEHDRFDDQLLAKAQLVAHLIQTRFQREGTSVARFVALGLAQESQAHLFTHLWFLQATTRSPITPVPGSLARKLTTQIQINDADLPRDAEGGATEYYQVTHEIGITWPPHLDDEEPLFMTSKFDPQKHVDWKTDDYALPHGKTVRRVQLKFVPATRITWGRPRRGSSSPTPTSGERPTPPPAPTVAVTLPWIVVHVAAEPIRRDLAITRLKSESQQKLAEQTAAAQEELSRLRQRLILIGVGAFLLTTLGGYFLVGLGLAPLRRLSEAVSQVSPRDFKLPISDDSLHGTELAPVADRLRETLEQLRRVFEREKQAAADISHELRTPVTSLLATLDVALKKPRTAEEYRQTLVDCRAVGGQMRQLVERLMALARLDAGSDRIKPVEIDVSELVEDVATMVKPLAGERGLKLHVDCPPDVTWKTDPDKLREILVNLLHNAIQYNKPNGSIDVSAETENGWLDLRVRDTGIGISPENSQRIFERFYRADPSRNANGLHAGLGLSIVKGYVGLLGGTVQVESQAGQGSTFHVRLPRKLVA
jgi:signal transduction histidine kinase